VRKDFVQIRRLVLGSLSPISAKQGTALPSWIKFANMEARSKMSQKFREVTAPVPFASMLLFNALIAASSSSSAESKELKYREMDYSMADEPQHLFLVVKEYFVWDPQAGEDCDYLTIEMRRGKARGTAG
jgi:hypothetical protein